MTTFHSLPWNDLIITELLFFQSGRQLHSSFSIKQHSGFQILWPRLSIWNAFYIWTRKVSWSSTSSWHMKYILVCFSEEEKASPDPLNCEQHWSRRPSISISWNSIIPQEHTHSWTLPSFWHLVAFSELIIFFQSHLWHLLKIDFYVNYWFVTHLCD